MEGDEIPTGLIIQGIKKMGSWVICPFNNTQDHIFQPLPVI